MGNNTNEPSLLLLHVHVCLHCSCLLCREEMEGRVHTTGLFVCPRCGKEGPLNIEIQEVGNDEFQRLKAQ